MSPATKKYVEQIQQIATESPLLLVAHAYTRYLGDLSGGQILKRVAKKAMKLPEQGDIGVAFYTFPGISNAKDFKNMYRERMDALCLPTEVQDAMCEEAIYAFRLNI